MDIAVYLRVSTQDQSYDLQKREILDYIEKRGWKVFKIYEEKRTGTTDKRLQFQELLKDARARKFDIVITWKLDRLFRSLKHLILTIQELTELKIDYISLKDNIDLTTSSGRLMLHLIGAFAEFEASIIKERVIAGLANAKAHGKKLGRPTQISSESVSTLRMSGLSLGQIAKQLGISKTAVHKTLKKLALQGAEMIELKNPKNDVH